VRLLTTEEGQRRWYDTHFGFGCNPFVDPLWADARFRAAMRALTTEPCPLARPWPIGGRRPAERPGGSVPGRAGDSRLGRGLVKGGARGAAAQPQPRSHAATPRRAESR
jgi:hypothetical protein